MSTETDTPNNPPAPAHIVEFAENEIAGTLLETCVRQLEALPNAWSLTSEANQQIAINKMRENIEKAVLKAVNIVATHRRPVIQATVKSVNFDDGIKAVLTISRGESGRHDLADATGSQVSVILISPNEFIGGTEKVKATPNQGALPLGEVASQESTEAQLQQSLPVIRINADGTFTIYKDEMPMPGGKGFASQADGEAWLQKQLGISKTSDDPARSSGDDAALAKKLADAVAAFKAAGATEAKKKKPDWDTGYNAISEKYDPDFLEEHYAVLSAAYATGFESSQE